MKALYHRHGPETSSTNIPTRGRPIGVVPLTITNRNGVMDCSREVKALGVKNIMTVDEAINRCPDIILVPPDGRTLDAAYEIARLLLMKAARRLRRSSYYC